MYDYPWCEPPLRVDYCDRISSVLFRLCNSPFGGTLLLPRQVRQERVLQLQLYGAEYHASHNRLEGSLWPKRLAVRPSRPLKLRQAISRLPRAGSPAQLSVLTQLLTALATADSLAPIRSTQPSATARADPRWAAASRSATTAGSAGLSACYQA